MPSQLSPRQSVVIGLLFIVCGLLPICIAIGVITPTAPSTSTAPPTLWVTLCCGLMFVAAGLLVVVDFGFARLGPDGQLAADTPLPIQLTSLLLALSVVGLLAAITGWIAFGSGPRRFTSTVSMPFYTNRHQTGELSGRIGFGLWTVLLVVAFGASGVLGVRRLWREWRRLHGCSRGAE
jgi:hypothetical protein